MQEINYKKGIPTLLLCFFIWGFQPLYWYICGEWDTYFLLACRIIWAAVCCLCILWAQGKLPQLQAVFRDKNILKREIPASVFLLADWGVYLWAVQNGRVLECSLGYYIQPIVVFILGAVIFREKVSWRHIVILAVVVVGIVLSTDGFNGIPYVTILLAVCFAIYAAIKRSLRIDSVVSTSAEIVMMVPLALLFILFFPHGRYRDGIHHAPATADAPGCGGGHSHAHGPLLCGSEISAFDDGGLLSVSKPHSGHRLRHDHGRILDSGKAQELLFHLGRCTPLLFEHRI